jgi:hypothetical protein
MHISVSSVTTVFSQMLLRPFDDSSVARRNGTRWLLFSLRLVLGVVLYFKLVRTVYGVELDCECVSL